MSEGSFIKRANCLYKIRVHHSLSAELFWHQTYCLTRISGTKRYEPGHIGPVTFFAKNTDQPFSILCLRPYGFATGSRTDIGILACRCALCHFSRHQEGPHRGPGSGYDTQNRDSRLRYWFWFLLAKKHWSPPGTSPNPPTTASLNGVQM